MLDPVTGDQNQVISAIKNASDAFNQNNAVVQAKLEAAFPGDPAQQEQARQQIVTNLNAAQAAAAAPSNARWFLPRDNAAGLVQSAMNERAQSPAPEVAPLEQFGTLDPGWIECVIDGLKTDLKGKAPFLQHQQLTDFLYPIADQVKIAIVGDWGGHNDAARAVADLIRASHPAITIHLGDIYYAGQDDEAGEALKIWPMADPVTGAIPPRSSYALNGNHEMYSGAHALFGDGKPPYGVVFKAFGQEASYFGLRNANWQILAFDSAYIEHRLLSAQDAAAPDMDARLASQWNWMVDKMRTSTLPTILLSHHEPVSAFSGEHDDGANLRADFQKFLVAAGRGVFAWFFGHEHQCTIYDPVIDPFSLPFPRLIGHGCIPHTPLLEPVQPDRGCNSFMAFNNRNLNGAAPCGFALLSFDGPSIDVQYIDQDGKIFFHEVMNAPQ